MELKTVVMAISSRGEIVKRKGSAIVHIGHAYRYYRALHVVIVLLTVLPVVPYSKGVGSLNAKLSVSWRALVMGAV